MKEFCVGKEAGGGGLDGEVVFLGPAFLETDDVGDDGWGVGMRAGLGEEVADVGEAVAAVVGDEPEA